MHSNLDNKWIEDEIKESFNEDASISTEMLNRMKMLSDRYDSWLWRYFLKSQGREGR